MYPSHFKYFGELIRILVKPLSLSPILSIKLVFIMNITGISAVYYYLKNTY